MMKLDITRILSWSGVILFGLVFLISIAVVEESIILSEGKISLLAGDYQGSLETFSGLSSSMWFGNEARMGLAISVIMSGSGDRQPALELDSDTEISRFHLSLLMLKTLREGNYQRLQLLARLGSHFLLETAPLYEAAAALELKDFPEAAKSLHPVAGKFGKSILKRKLAEALELVNSGKINIVRDRNGETIGYFEANGDFSLVDEELKRYLQPVYLKNALNRPRGNGIILSIDLDASRYAFSLLEGSRGSIVLLEEGSNEILVAVSDEKTRAKMGEISSPAFEQQLEPASISKLITTVAALRAGIDPDEVISHIFCNGAKKYAGEILWCASKQGHLSGLNHALAASCNISFADLGVMIGWEGMLLELKNFGFDTKSGNPYSLGNIVRAAGNDRHLADLSIGLENTEANTLHCALLASVFANKGYFKDPEFVHATDGYLGYSLKKPQRDAGRRAVESRWLPRIAEAMKEVSISGTAKNIAPWDFPVAMKTGTGGNWGNGFHINYVGYGPSEAARLTFGVRITNKSRSFQARRTGYSVTKKLLHYLKKRDFVRSEKVDGS